MNAYEKIKPYLENGTPVPVTSETVSSLIHAIKELEKQIQNQAMDEVVKIGQEIDATPQTKPLTDEEIKKLQKELIKVNVPNIITFVRAIEERILGK